ncbi:hypothetical protein [Tautonia plasticadhaerens]|uniref:Phosphoadenosine phosphosulphate reductase domain-containing protein n=1 Tax=Tautonia plasticadhaerens TaxID=2527974 RepID=A0A518H7N3_9BACT|nr:hypothetical protein [Tautonia plasticadhaerens]QDV36878.1 hypothetical protein ElP_48080 [Tautonia plasticadhaerens]
MESTETYHILNLGAGVQSTALYLMFVNGEFDEQIDYAVFADTHEEPESVYKHLEWLRSLGGPPILIDSAGRLGDDLIHGKNSTGQRFASIPAFTSATPGKTGGMLRRQCTAEYKINVVEKIIRRQVVGLEYRQRMPKGVKVVQYFGLSYDEPRRVAKVKARFVGHPWAEGRFPLFDLEMSRDDCLAYLKQQAIPHEVPRSACVFCPYRSNAEWRHLRDTDPAGLGQGRRGGRGAAEARNGGESEPGAGDLPAPVVPAAGQGGPRRQGRDRRGRRGRVRGDVRGVIRSPLRRGS